MSLDLIVLGLHDCQRLVDWKPDVKDKYMQLSLLSMVLEVGVGNIDLIG